MFLSERQEITSVGQGMEKREPSCTFDGNVNIELLYYPAIPILGIYPKEENKLSSQIPRAYSWLPEEMGRRREEWGKGFRRYKLPVIR